MPRLLFVIGAGASKDFGLPLGSELVDLIRGRLTSELANSHSRTIIDAASGTGIPGDYEAAARDVAGALVTAMSIDRLIDSRSGRPLVEAIGKAAITHIIAESERQASIASGLDSNWLRRQEALENMRATWLGALFALLTNGVRPENAGTVFRDVSFITFNYDRCIEAYLYSAILHTLNQSREEAAEIVRSIPIIHVYGSLGTLPELGTSPNLCPIGGADGLISTMSYRIRTFTQSMEEETQNKIRSQVKDADIVIFLGFAFDPLNVQVLFDEPLANHQKACGTSLGVAPPTLSLFRARAAPDGAEFEEMRAAEYLRTLRFREIIGF